MSVRRRPSYRPSPFGISPNRRAFTLGSNLAQKEKQNEKLKLTNIGHGAGDGDRTRTSFLTADFKSDTSSNSVTPAYFSDKRCLRSGGFANGYASLCRKVKLFESYRIWLPVEVVPQAGIEPATL